ncbi:MAG TPA: hypothetical protein VF220_04990 [Nitrososphaeraceae archaeon]
MSKCSQFENEGSKRNQEISNVILLNYSSNGDQKFGVVKLNVCYNFDKDELNYLDIAYSDDDIKSFIAKNPFVLSKIGSSRK